LKENNMAIGSIGLMTGKKSNLDIDKDEAEIGYWPLMNDIRTVHITTITRLEWRAQNNK